MARLCSSLPPFKSKIQHLLGSRFWKHFAVSGTAPVMHGCMDASMACHTEKKDSKDSGKSRGKHIIRHVIPALPLRPVQRRPALDKARDAASVENRLEHSASEPLPPGGQATPDPDQAIKVQFGEMEEDHKHNVYYSPASFGNNTSLAGVAPSSSSLPPATFALARRGISNSEKSLLDASNNNDTSTPATSTQATSSWTSSSPPNFKPSSDSDSAPHTRQQPLHTSVVELPAEASISLSSSLNISFLYQQESDSDSTGSTPYSEFVIADMAAQQLNGPCTSASDFIA